MTKIERAEQLAKRAHEGQFRKYGNPPLPYFVHPQEVAELTEAYCKENNLSPEVTERMVAAAAMHDVLEDCPQITPQEIIDATDQETYNLVLDLTNPSKGSKSPRAVRKQMDRDHLALVSKEAKIIKMIDRICNLRDIKLCDDKRFIDLYANESIQLVKAVEDADPDLATWLKTVCNALLEATNERHQNH